MSGRYFPIIYGPPDPLGAGPVELFPFFVGDEFVGPSNLLSIQVSGWTASEPCHGPFTSYPSISRTIYPCPVVTVSTTPFPPYSDLLHRGQHDVRL